MATQTCNYQYPKGLEHAPCPELAWQSHDPYGRCFFHSERPDKVATEMVARVKEKLARNDRDFAGYIFPAEADFSTVDFGDGANFGGAAFRGTANFLHATFGDRAYFVGAIFGDWANFIDTRFGDRAYFGNAAFRRGASFWVARFGDGANFLGADFSGGANFVQATFAKEGDFFGATFDERADFSGATFADGAGFRIANPRERFLLQEVTFQGRADFSGATQDLSHFEFHHVRLPQAIFRDAIGLDKAEFDDVTWGVLGDEVDARESGKLADYAAAERVYREVRRSYLERRDFTMARQMHWGEMEMRRLGEAARRRENHRFLGWGPLAHISLTWLYWLISGYGQRWLNALVALVALWLICTLGYTAELLSLANPTPDFAEALTNGASQSLFSLILRPVYSSPTFGGQVLNFLELALSPIIITTLVLAVREQFRH